MKLFGLKKNRLELKTTAEYFIAATAKATGRIETESDVIIDGVFDGQINTSGLLEIGKNAKVDGKFEARALIVEGQIKGQAKIRDEIQIKRCGIVKAELDCGEIEVEKGAVINGKLEVRH